MCILGQFRDLDDPDCFVWMRGFADMETRKGALESFYRGPVWSSMLRRPTRPCSTVTTSCSCVRSQDSSTTPAAGRRREARRNHPECSRSRSGHSRIPPPLRFPCSSGSTSSRRFVTRASPCSRPTPPSRARTLSGIARTRERERLRLDVAVRGRSRSCSPRSRARAVFRLAQRVAGPHRTSRGVGGDPQAVSDGTLGHPCLSGLALPNSGGNLVPRPIRPPTALATHPPSRRSVFNPDCRTITNRRSQKAMPPA